MCHLEQLDKWKTNTICDPSLIKTFNKYCKIFQQLHTHKKSKLTHGQTHCDWSALECTWISMEREAHVGVKLKMLFLYTKPCGSFALSQVLSVSNQDLQPIRLWDYLWRLSSRYLLLKLESIFEPGVEFMYHSKPRICRFFSVRQQQN